MIKTINMKTLENVRDGLKNGADFAMERTRRVEFRKPWQYRNLRHPSWVYGPGFWGIMVFSSLAAVIAGFSVLPQAETNSRSVQPWRLRGNGFPERPPDPGRADGLGRALAGPQAGRALHDPRYRNIHATPIPPATLVPGN